MVIVGRLPHTCPPSCCLFLLFPPLSNVITNQVHEEKALLIHSSEGALCSIFQSALTFVSRMPPLSRHFLTELSPNHLFLQMEFKAFTSVKGDGEKLEVGGTDGSMVKDPKEKTDVGKMRTLVSEFEASSPF